ncbi:hypothetical protein F4779DRAFT_21585 [Xylariaceae sp. FL0662B]|nr:hypothetical protein F4779DRAFT_21585 [Xylariaceae sp. FL0662B]
MLVRIWDNPRFDTSLNPEAHRVSIEELPYVIRGIQVPVLFFTERDRVHNPDQDHDGDLRRRREILEGPDEMRGDGSPEEDTYLNSTPMPGMGKACMLHPARDGKAYFFFRSRYVAINTKPGTISDTIAWGPKNIVDNWPSLVEAQFGSIDAVLPVSGGEMYFFCMDRYVVVDIKPGTTNDTILFGPEKIATGWPSLYQAGFNYIDAVL